MKQSMKSMTAERLFEEIRKMPAGERVRFFSLVAAQAFGDEDYSHEEVFGHLHETPFSAAEAAEFLEVSLPTLRRHVQAGELVPTRVVGRSQLFCAEDLQAFKYARMVRS